MLHDWFCASLIYKYPEVESKIMGTIFYAFLINFFFVGKKSSCNSVAGTDVILYSAHCKGVCFCILAYTFKKAGRIRS